LLQCFEFDILWSMGFICDWERNLIIVMGTHRAKGSSSADVHVKLVLEINE
jgi:hypothetical protein